MMTIITAVGSFLTAALLEAAILDARLCVPIIQGCPPCPPQAVVAKIGLAAGEWIWLW